MYSSLLQNVQPLETGHKNDAKAVSIVETLEIAERLWYALLMSSSELAIDTFLLSLYSDAVHEKDIPLLQKYSTLHFYGVQ